MRQKRREERTRLIGGTVRWPLLSQLLFDGIDLRAFHLRKWARSFGRRCPRHWRSQARKLRAQGLPGPKAPLNQFSGKTRPPIRRPRRSQRGAIVQPGECRAGAPRAGKAIRPERSGVAARKCPAWNGRLVPDYAPGVCKVHFQSKRFLAARKESLTLRPP